MRSSMWLVLLVASACDGTGRTSDAPGSLSEPETLAVLQSTCQAEIMEGAPAQAAAVSVDVQNFASMIINDETAALQHLQELSIQPLPTAASKLIDSEAKQTTEMLQSLQGVELDREFMAHEIVIHAARIDLLAHSILPYVSDKSMRSIITVQITTAQQHLRMAIDINRNDVK
jgi:predicted outer membrane protein